MKYTVHTLRKSQGTTTMGFTLTNNLKFSVNNVRERCTKVHKGLTLVKIQLE